MEASKLSMYEVAKIIHGFLHPVKPEPSSEPSKSKVVIIKKGKRIELYDLSLEEIEKVLEQ